MVKRTGWLTLIAVASMGCSSASTADGGAAEDESAIQLNLTTTAPSGNQYRLGPASFEIDPVYGNGGHWAIDATGEEGALHVRLPADWYEVRLQDGWTLSRLTPAGAMPVAATLTSAPVQTTKVYEFQTTPVTFAFHLGESGVDIGVSVDEGPPAP
jgi:hypothetical protein